MNHPQPQTVKESYLNIYKGTTILLKISGEEIYSEDFLKAAADITQLTREGLKFIIATGAQKPLDQKWAEKFPDVPRPKDPENGYGISSKTVIEMAQEVEKDIRKRFLSVFEVPLHFVEPQQIDVEPKDLKRYQYVGSVSGIRGLIPEAPINVIGNLGMHGQEVYNINADEIPLAVLNQFPDLVNEVILLTGAGGIRDKKGNIAPLLSEDDIDRILSGSHPDIIATGPMTGKLIQIKEILQKAGKVALTKTSLLYDELMDIDGTGTLFANLLRGVLPEMEPWERPIFMAIYEKNVKEGRWKERTSEELEIAMRYHRFLKVNKSILGGASIIPHAHSNWAELACLWSADIGSGAGSIILDYVNGIASGAKRNLFAITKSDKVGTLFSGSDYDYQGLLKNSQHKIPDLPDYLKHYENPDEKMLFIRRLKNR